MIQNLQQIFHSITKSLEVLYVIENAKPCARILVFEDKLSETINFLNENKIHSTISNFKVLKQTLQSEFYSDKSIKIPKTSLGKGYFFLYLSKDKEIAEKAKHFEEQNNRLELGVILGYPKCCCEFFQENFGEKNTDLTLNVLENSNGFEFPFYNNIAARHFDFSLLSHFPHNFDCMPSIEIAKSNLKVIQKNSGHLASIISDILHGVVIYTMEEGILFLGKPEKLNDDIIYSDILTTTKNKLYYLLSANKKLKIIDKGSFIVNGMHIKGPKYGIMLFT